MNTWALLDREYRFSIRHLLGRPTCFLLVFTHNFSCVIFFLFCTDSLQTCSYSHLSLHTRYLFAEIAYQITQVPREFNTRFLPFYSSCAIRCTCRKRTIIQCPMHCHKQASNNLWKPMCVHCVLLYVSKRLIHLHK